MNRSKPWLIDPPPIPVRHVVVVGAGIAGASTAHALATRGIHVTVLEQDTIASGASGNHQGLLYAKISAADTAQNALLNLAYPYVLKHLQQTFPQADFWSLCGLLQLAHTDSERQRQLKLLQQTTALCDDWQQQNVALHQAMPTVQGLWWPQGGCVSPPLWVQALLQHPNIGVHEHSPVCALNPSNGGWQITTPSHTLQASHVIICTGASSLPLPHIQHLQLKHIRGQVAYAQETPASTSIQAAISGAHYFTPAFQGQHTFGASFVLGDSQTEFRTAEHQHNLTGLAAVLPQLAATFSQQNPAGRASVRADSIDHLPVMGPVGNANAMRQIYAKLAADKNYPIATPCPYWDGLWVNTAHGTRGMLTAVLCAHSLANRLTEQKDVLPQTLQDSLHPNRLLIRQLIYPNA